MLSCHHSYCKDCINHLPVELDNGRHVVKCPSCRHPTQLSEREAADLPTTFHINGCLEIDQLLKTQITDNEDRCAQDKAVQFPLCKAQQLDPRIFTVNRVKSIFVSSAALSPIVITSVIVLNSNYLPVTSNRSKLVSN